jgi:DNA invertase Pin-like site-specific DNA recombinase
MRSDSRAWLKDKRVAGYIRESTVAQGKDDRFGPEIQKYAQEHAVERYGARPISHTYTDLVSGTNALRRSDFQRMVADARVKAFDVLFAYDVSRFARNETDAWVYLDALKDVGVPVYLCDEDILTIIDEDWRDQVGAHINAAAAYSRKLSRNVRRGYHRKWDRGGYGGYPPFGYRRTADKLGLEPNEDAPVRALVIERYASGRHSFASLADELNRDGYRCRSGLFTKGVVAKIIGNPIVIGVLRRHPGDPDSEVRENAAAAIVSRDTWDAAQRIAHRRGDGAGRRRFHYVFSGLARCADCGERLWGQQVVRRNKTNYRTRTYRQLRHTKAGCRRGMHNERKLVASFGEFLAHWQLPSDARERIARYLAGRSRSDEILVRRRGFEEQLERIRNLYRWGDMTEDAYLTQRRLLTRDLEALPIADDRVPPGEAIALASRVGELWGEMTDDERRRFVEEWFEELRLGRDGTIAVRARETYREIVFSALDAWWRSDPSRQRDGTRTRGDTSCARHLASLHAVARDRRVDSLELCAIEPAEAGQPEQSPAAASRSRIAPTQCWRGYPWPTGMVRSGFESFSSRFGPLPVPRAERPQNVYASSTVASV